MPPAGEPVMSDQDLLAEVGVNHPQAMPQNAPQTMTGQSPVTQQQMAPQQQMVQPMMEAAPSDAPPAQGFAFAAAQPVAADMPAEPAGKKKKGKLSKDEKRALAAQKKEDKERAKADKKAKAAEKAEEKKRAKRRKKLAKTRFSRARYLRESNGNAIAGVVLWIFLIITFIVAPFMLNTAFLIPQTNENLRVASEAESLRRSIVVNRPQITATAEKRKTKEGQIRAFTTSFVPRADAQKQLEALGVQLEEAGLEVTPGKVNDTPLLAKSITGTTMTITVTGNYLDWLRVRNKFVRTQRAISIPAESVSVNAETGLMEISAQIIVPSAR